MKDNDSLFWYSIGLIAGTLGSHFIGEPLIGFSIGMFLLLVSIGIMIVKFVKRGKAE